MTEAVLTNLLGDQVTLRLVILNSCEGARTTLDSVRRDRHQSVALGMPAVVAMQFTISDSAAIVFAEELFTSLIGRQYPIDAAVSEARKAVFTEVNEIEWATPVLFLRTTGPVRLRRVAGGRRGRGRDGCQDHAPAVDDGIAATTAVPGGRGGGRGRRSWHGGRHGLNRRSRATAGGATTTAGGAATAGGATTTAAAGTGAPPGPPSSGAPPTVTPPTGPRQMAQPQAKRVSSASRPWMIGVIAVVVVVLLLGGLSAAGLFGTAQETPGASNATGSADTTTTHAYPVVPGTKDEWVGPRRSPTTSRWPEDRRPRSRTSARSRDPNPACRP